MSPVEKIKGVHFWWMTLPGYWLLPPSIAQCEQSQGNFWQCNWNVLGHHHAWSICFIKYLAAQYPVTLARCTLRYVSKQYHLVCEQNIGASETVASSTSPNVNRELLLIPGLNCIMRVNITSRVPVVETLNALPCEVCFVSEEYMAAKGSSSHW